MKRGGLMRMVLYRIFASLTVLVFVGMGLSAARAGEGKAAVIAFLFAAANGCIFWWK